MMGLLRNATVRLQLEVDIVSAANIESYGAVREGHSNLQQNPSVLLVQLNFVLGLFLRNL